jgi:hypothetical protein
MVQYNPSISGSLSVTGSLIVTNGVIGTVNGVDIQIFSSSISQVVTNIQTATGSQDGRLTSIESFTSSVSTTNTFTASTSARLNSIETISASNLSRIGSLETISASNIARINSLETTSASVDTLNIVQNSRLTSLEIRTGSLATTGSNTFIGTQTITGSLFISANLVVQGTSSLQNITASAVSIGTNIVNLNTANPAIRYAGLVIGDSGSVGGSGSFLYDSVQDEMLFIHRGDSSVVTSSVALMGPETYDNLGNEIYLTNNRLPKGTGKEHLVDSNISDTGTLVTINSVTSSFSGLVGINCSTPSYNLDVNGVGRFSRNATPLILENTENVELVLRRSSTTNGAGLGLYTNSTHNWLIGTAWGETSSNFVLYNAVCSNKPLVINSSNNVATFGSSVNVGGASTTNDLNIYNANNAGITLQTSYTGTTGSDGFYIGQSFQSTNFLFRQRENADIIFETNNGSDRLHITSNGNVGIGVSTPCNLFHVRCNVTGDITVARFTNSPGTGNEGVFIGFETGYPQALSLIGARREGAENDASIIFSPMLNEAACERMRITSGGRIGIGITSPQAQLDVYQCGGNGLRACTALYLRAGNDSNIFCSNQILFGYDGTANYAHAIKTRHNSNGFCDNAIDFYTWKCGDAISTPAGQYIMTIAGNGTLGIGTCTPSTLLDARCSVAENTNGSVLNSHPIATFAVNAAGGGQRGLQFGGPTGGVISPVFLKVFGTGNRFSILNESNCENLTVTSGGQVRKPFQPSFQVYRVGQDCIVTNTAEQRLTFQCIRYDVGSNTSSSGIFTAPLCGRYSFSSTVRYDGASNDTSYLRLFFAVNGCSGTPGFTYGHAIAGPGSYSTSYHSMSVSAVLHLNVGDTVSVNGGINVGTVGVQFESQFSGYFVG